MSFLYQLILKDIKRYQKTSKSLKCFKYIYKLKMQGVSPYEEIQYIRISF